MTKQYMPTTAEVRDSYRFSNKRPDICGKDFGAEFDRWLAEHDRQVAEKAWDAGFMLATRNSPTQPHPLLNENPYRKEQSNE